MKQKGEQANDTIYSAYQDPESQTNKSHIGGNVNTESKPQQTDKNLNKQNTAQDQTKTNNYNTGSSAQNLHDKNKTSDSSNTNRSSTDQYASNKQQNISQEDKGHGENVAQRISKKVSDMFGGSGKQP